MQHSVILMNRTSMHSVNKGNAAYFNRSVMFVEYTKQVMYRKWNTALLADLIWTCGQHVLFRNIFGCFVYICVKVVIILIFLLTDLQVTIFQILVSMPSIINPKTDINFLSHIMWQCCFNSRLLFVYINKISTQ